MGGEHGYQPAWKSVLANEASESRVKIQRKEAEGGAAAL